MTEEEILTIESAHEDGVFEIVHGASALIAKLTSDVLYALDLESSGDRETLGIEASFGMQQGRRVIARLGVRVRNAVPAVEIAEAIVCDAVERFGGQGYANLCVSPPGDRTHELDVTVSASALFSWLSELVLLAPVAEGQSLRGAYRDVLRALGLEPRESDSALALPRRRLRAPPSAREQAAAFASARRHGLTATLYSAAIPATRSLRIEDAASHRAWYVGQGLSGGEPCTEADVRTVQRFLEERTGARFGGRRWTIRVAPADTPPPREERRRRGVRFTFWVKGNR